MKLKSKLLMLVLTGILFLTACGTKLGNTEFSIGDKVYTQEDIKKEVDENKSEMDFSSISEYILWNYIEYSWDKNERKEPTNADISDFYGIDLAELTSLSEGEDTTEYDLIKKSYIFQTEIEHLLRESVEIPKDIVQKIIQDGKNKNMLFLQGIYTDTEKLENASKEEKEKLLEDFRAKIVIEGEKYTKLYGEDKLNHVNEKLDDGLLTTVVYTPMKSETHKHGEELAVGESVVTEKDGIVDVLYKIGEVDIPESDVKDMVVTETVKNDYPTQYDILKLFSKTFKDIELGSTVDSQLKKESDKEKESLGQ